MLYYATAASLNMKSEYGEFSRLKCFDNFSDEFRRGYFFVLFFVIYVLPLSFIAITCIEIVRVLLRGIADKSHRNCRQREANRRKVAKMVIVVVIAFVVCWTPYFLVNVVTQLQNPSFMHERQFFFTMLCLNLLAFLNSCVNPFIYAAMSARFRTGFIRLIRILLCMPTNASTSQLNTSLMSHRSAAASFSDNSMEHGGSVRSYFSARWHGLSRFRSLSRASRRTLSFSLRSSGRSRVGSVSRGSARLSLRPVGNPKIETTTLMLNGNTVHSTPEDASQCPCRVVDTVVVEKDVTNKQVTIVATTVDCNNSPKTDFLSCIECTEHLREYPFWDNSHSPTILTSQSFPNLSSEGSSISSEESHQEWPSTRRLITSNKSDSKYRRSNSVSIISSFDQSTLAYKT